MSRSFFKRQFLILFLNTYSINGRLSTVRTFAKIAARAGGITAEESILIASVEGYANKEARHIDEKRKADGMDTRKSNKKAEAVTIPEDIARALKQQADTPQGRRDALIMCFCWIMVYAWERLQSLPEKPLS